MHQNDHEYDDDCPGCQPALMDAKTGKVMESDHPVMVSVLKAWKEKITFLERQATSRVWMGMSHNPRDMEIMQRVGEIISQAIQNAENAKKKEILSEFDKAMDEIASGL